MHVTSQRRLVNSLDFFLLVDLMKPGSPKTIIRTMFIATVCFSETATIDCCQSDKLGKSISILKYLEALEISSFITLKVFFILF